MSINTVSPLESSVEEHIDSTSRLVRRVDLALSLLIVCSIILGGLFLAILADHWFLKDGLSMLMRFGIFAALFAAVGAYTYWRIVPLFRYPINPVYTADLIEKDVPTFKNSLINWLLLRQEREEREGMPTERINDKMFDGIVRTAAGHVKTVPVGHAIDYRKLIWVGTFATILLLAFIAYAIFSPKSSAQTFIRIALPFAGIERPQAAQFRNVDPGDTTVLQGETLTISAEVISRSAEPVYLVFSTDDGQAVNQRMPMLRPEGRIAFETPFPPGRQGLERGFNSSVDYWITQGESRSQQYRIEVHPAATVEIVSLRYDFPAYTGLEAETIEHGGDIRALEGTAVTVVVRSTLPLQEIALVFDDTPTNRVRMTVNGEGTEARGTFTLKHPYPHQTFAFQATDTNGNASRRSGIYRIEVIPDQPPKVQWADTADHLKEPRIDVPLNQALPLPIQAEDPDFALRYLRFKAESPGKRIPDVQLLNSPQTGPTEHRGQISKTTTFSPAEKGLAVGDTAEIWVEALDTKLPEANVSTTRKITIQVVAPQEKEDDPDQDQEQKGNDGEQKQDDKQESNQPNPEQNGPSEGEDPNNSEQQEGEHGGDPQEQDAKEGEGGDAENSGDQGQDTNNPQQNQEDGKGQDSEGSSGSDGDQSGESDGDSGEGGAGNATSDKEGQNASEGQVNNGQASDESANNQPTGDQQGGGEGGDPAGGQQQRAAEPSPNHETQPGEAMERIVDQMKKDGKIDENGDRPQNQGEKDDKTQNSAGGTGPRERDDTLDPNSQNRSDTGGDASNPQQSAEGNQQDQSGDGGSESGDPAGEGEADTASGQPGDGSESSQGGDQQSGASQDGQGAQGEGNQGDQQQGAGDGSPEQQQGNPQQGTEPGDDSGGTPQRGEGTGGGEGIQRHTTPDDLNLEYAEKVTNLVLEYLEDQLKDKPSDALLDRLGWNEEQLRQFYAKWKDMSDKSKQPQQQEDGSDFWKEALKSLGLRPPNPDRAALQQNQTRVQDEQKTTEATRFPTPASLLDRVRRLADGIGR